MTEVVLGESDFYFKKMGIVKEILMDKVILATQNEGKFVRCATYSLSLAWM